MMKKFLVSGIISGFLILILMFAVNAIVAVALPFDAATLPGMRSMTDPLYILFFLYPFVLGFIFVFAYRYIQDNLIGGYLEKGKKFGAIMWIIVSVPSIFVVFTSMDYPIGFTVSQIVASLLYSLGAGMLIARIYE